MEAKKPTPAQWPQIDSFLTQNLRQKVNWTLSQEYPLAFAEKNRSNIRIISEGNEIISHAVVHPSLIRTNYHLFKVGLIGSVVTKPEQQGKGHSRKILESCIEACQQQDCDFSMLWTDKFNFYSKFGYEMAGSEVALQFDQNFKPASQNQIKILNSNKVSAQAILRLYNQHSLRTLRQVPDIEKFLKIPDSKVYTAWNNTTNTLEAYAIMGKGADFTNYIHEWGGKVSTLNHLLKHIQEETQSTITLICPPQCSNLIRQAEAAGARKFLGILGMIKITNPVQFCQKIIRGARACGYDKFVFEYRDGTYLFGYKEEIYQTQHSEDIVRLCFGPATPKQIFNFSDEALEVLSDIFPVAFWVWGWDSI